MPRELLPVQSRIAIPRRVRPATEPAPAWGIGQHQQRPLAQRASQMHHGRIDADNYIHRRNRAGSVAPILDFAGQISHETVKAELGYFLRAGPNLQ